MSNIQRRKSDPLPPAPPQLFAPQVTELAEREMANASTTYDKVKALERFLRAFDYDEGIPGAGRG